MPADDVPAPDRLLIQPVYTRACYRGDHPACVRTVDRDRALFDFRCDCGCHLED